MWRTRASITRRCTGRRHVAWLVCLIGVTAGCSQVIGPVPAAPEPVQDAMSKFPECAAESYDFVGESTLAALELQGHVPAPLPDPGRLAMIWVTHDLKEYDRGEPGGPVELTRMLCFEFADGTGGSGWPVDEAWQPPAP